MELNKEQKLAVQTDATKVLVAAGAGSGKCQPDYTLIPTPEGLKRLDELQIGDIVYGRFGQEEEVLGIFPQGEKEIFSILFEDGREVECCEEHLWSIDDGKGGLQTKSLKELMGMRQPLKIPCLTTPIHFSKRERDNSFQLNKNSLNYDDILFSSIEERIGFLKGLCQLMGNYNSQEDTVIFEVKDEKLADSITFLCRSLGLYCVKEKRIEKKVSMVKLFLNKETSLLSIKSITPKGKKTSMRCIWVNDPEHLYLTNDFIVTHNTRVIMERIKFLLEQGVEARKIYAITYTNAAAAEMRKRLDENARDVFIGTIHSLANRILIMNGIDTSSQIENENFDWLLEQIYKKQVEVPLIDHLLVDEFQDICKNEYMFITKDLKAKNWFFVGDSQQCQPAGTKIRLRNNIFKNIEDIQIGDSICWYDSEKNLVCSPTTKAWNTVEKKVEKISKRPFVNDNFITITTKTGEKSTYTPNHRTFVKLNENSNYNHAVYLMCDNDNNFRIGKIPFIQNDNNCITTWKEKMLAEECSKFWILKLFKTDKEARDLEQKLSHKYGIPQTYCQLNKPQETEENVNSIYKSLSPYSAAEKCLKEYNRNIHYPMLDKNTEAFRQSFAYDVVTEIYACNIMPEVMSALIYDANLKSQKRYSQIVSVDFQPITEPIDVYSLQVEGETYVADDIITHNSIYSFKGANHEYFMGLTLDPTVTVFKLTSNYRCGEDIIDFGESFLSSVSNIYRVKNNCMTARRGYVEVATFTVDRILEELENESQYKDWFILCRTNAEVDDIITVLKRNNIPCDSFKKSELELSELDEKLKEDTVKVLTIHSSKGLENKNVIVIGAHPYNDEEKRISYVAATRAKENLIWMTAKRKQKRPSPKHSNFKTFGEF